MSNTDDPTLPLDLAALPLQTEATSDTKQAPSRAEMLAQTFAAGKAILDDQRGISECADAIGIVPGRFGAYRRREELAILRAVAGLGAAHVHLPERVPFDHSIAESIRSGLADSARIDPRPGPARVENVRTRHSRMDGFSRFRSDRSGKPTGSKLWKKAKKGKP